MSELGEPHAPTGAAEGVQEGPEGRDAGEGDGASIAFEPGRDEADGVEQQEGVARGQYKQTDQFAFNPEEDSQGINKAESKSEAAIESERTDRGTEQNVPPEAFKAADYADSHNGAAQPDHAGNRPFANDGRNNSERLPSTDQNEEAITYKEYDIHPTTPGVNRGSERIVIGSDGSRYYTSDHYRSFTQF